MSKFVAYLLILFVLSVFGVCVLLMIPRVVWVVLVLWVVIGLVLLVRRSP